MLSSNSSRGGAVWALWSLAWSAVAVSVALAEICLSRVAARVEAGLPALWKRVMISRVLCWRDCNGVSQLCKRQEQGLSSANKTSPGETKKHYSQSGTCWAELVMTAR